MTWVSEQNGAGVIKSAVKAKVTTTITIIGPVEVKINKEMIFLEELWPTTMDPASPTSG